MSAEIFRDVVDAVEGRSLSGSRFPSLKIPGDLDQNVSETLLPLHSLPFQTLRGSKPPFPNACFGHMIHCSVLFYTWISCADITFNDLVSYRHCKLNVPNR